MTSWLSTILDSRLVAQTALIGMGLDLLGGCYLAYDLLGGRQGPLRTISRAAGYTALFFFGYSVVIGPQYATVAALGMGGLLAIEYRIAGRDPAQATSARAKVICFGFLRGAVLGLAGMTVAGAWFGGWFGLLSGIGLGISYAAGFAPTDDYEAGSRPRVSRHKIVASALRTIIVSLGGMGAVFLAQSSGTRHYAFGLRLGLAAGAVSALVGLFSPLIEWRIETLEDNRLGMVGLALIFAGMVLQSIQYWVVVFNVQLANGPR
jgi:hypothetical protein